MRMGVTVDITRAIAGLDRLARTQVPFATSRALNAVAEKVVEAEQHEMKSVFDRPTAYTLNSLTVDRSDKRKLQAVVRFKRPTGRGTSAEKFLAAEIKGGSRRAKRFELALQAAGVMPAGYRAVPGRNVRLDANGNIPGALLRRVMKEARGQALNRREASQRAGRVGKRYGSEMVFIKPGAKNLSPGVWERVKTGFGGAVRPILLFVPRAQYVAIYRFHEIGEQTVRREFGPIWDREMEAALRTAR